MLACLTAPAGAQNAAPSTAERSYPYPLAQVKQSLQQLGAYAGGRLPMLDGFVASDTPQLDRYQRPYYQYRIELNPVDANHTSVKVEAKLSAWYADTDPSRAGYRSLTSNGHLENDLLDQLQDALSPKSTNQSAAGKPGLASSSRPMPSRAAAVPAQPVASPAYAPDARQQKLDDLLAEKLAVEQKTNALKAQILHMEQAARLQTTATQFASVKHTGTGVMSQMNYGGPVLFRTRAEDEFEVVEKQGEWVRVRLGPDSTGWIASEGLNLPEEKVASRPTAQSPDQSELGFWVSREQINEFSGEWPQLQGKKVLFVFAQSRGLLPDLANDDRKLVYAKKIFADRYRASTLSQDPFEGVVVIFMGGKGGVAAATLADIKQWVKGSLGEAEFVKRCSLDPPGEFQTLRKTP
jgi:hypothetical protein